MNRATPDWIHNNEVADLKREINRLEAELAVAKMLNETYRNRILALGGQPTWAGIDLP